MRSFVLTLIAAFAVAAAALSAHAGPVTVGAASGIQAAFAETSAVQDAAYVCRHRSFSSRRVCWWRPTYRHRYWRSRRWW